MKRKAMTVQKNACRVLALVAAVQSVQALAQTGTNWGPSSVTASGSTRISISGSTALRNFTVASAFTFLTPGTSITLSNGFTYTADANVTSYQLAGSPGFDAATVPTNVAPVTPNAGQIVNVNALRVEWHEQGSVEGIRDLVDSQIDDSIQANTGYNAVASGNGVFINRVGFGRVNPSTGNTGNTGSTSVPAAGASQTTSGFIYTAFSNTDPRDRVYTGNSSNLAGGNQFKQAPVQMAISDVVHQQAFSVAGTAAFNRTPGQAGFGQGNPALTTFSTSDNRSIGVANARRYLIPETFLNLGGAAANTDGGPTLASKVDPATNASYNATYASTPSAPWLTGGVNNLQSTGVAAAATTFAANPGTGLQYINRLDAQFLQTSGRLPNGADFNVVTRDVNSGTLNVAALNVGLDPSYVVGENDGGGVGTAANERSIGTAIRFSNKQAGGDLNTTVQASRLAVGHLGLSDARNVAAQSSATPIRVLGYADSLTGTATSAVLPQLSTILDGTYAIWQTQQYVTVKAPDVAGLNAFLAANPGATAADIQAWWAGRTDAQTGIKGDDSANSVRQVRDNVVNAIASNQFLTSNTVANASDGIIAQGFIPLSFLQFRRAFDGGALVPNPAPAPAADLNTFTSVFADRYSLNRTSTSGSTVNTALATNVTTGTTSFYGLSSANGIAIRGDNTTGNWLFGNFDQRGVRDFRSVVITAQTLQNALATGSLGTNWAQGATQNNTIVSGTLTKGDLIALGDFNSDGNFNGQDLYLLARGQSLADSYTSNTVTATGAADFSSRINTAVLRKNAGLDYLLQNATATQRADARASASIDPTGANAFNKFDVNRDGRVNLQDAFIVDRYNGFSISNLQNQLDAVVGTDGTFNNTTSTRNISLVDVKLVDSANAIGQADATALSGGTVTTFSGGTASGSVATSNGLTGSVQNNAWSGQTVKPGSLNFTVVPAAGSVTTVSSGAGLSIPAGTITTTGSLYTGSNLATGRNVSALVDTTSGNLLGGPALNLTVGSTGSVVVSNLQADRIGGRAPVTVLNTLSIATGGRVDLTTTDLIVRNSSYSALAGLVASGALASTGRYLDSLAGVTTLAVFSNFVDATTPFFTSYDGVQLSPTDTIVKWTLIGDTNLDGMLDGTDLANIIEGLSTPGSTTWAQGDFNYSGTVTLADLNLFYTTQSLLGVGNGASVGDGAANSLVTGAVPEPTALGLLAAAVPMLSRRRRSK